MKTIKLFVILPFVFFTLNFVYGQDAIPLKNIDTYMTNAMKNFQIPGAALAIIKEGKVVFAKGYGVRELGKNDKVDENTVFGIGSNTKAFTATTLVMLANEKKLSLDDKVTKFLPDYQLYDTLASDNITVRDLLCHRIGFGTWQGDFVAWGSSYSRDEVVRRMRYMKPVFGFRAGYGYCNTAFVTAGQVIAKVAGKPWEEVVEEKLIKPLGMKRTSTVFNELKSTENIAMPHTFSDEKMVVIPWRNLDNIGAAASINSSVTDMAKWLLLQMDTTGAFNSILEQKLIKRTHVPVNVVPRNPYWDPDVPSRHFSSYGLGWFLGDYQGKFYITHTGAVDGFLSRTAIVPEQQLAFVLLTNTDDNNLITAIFYQLLDAYAGAPYKDWSQFFYDNWKKDHENAKNEWTAKEGARRKDLAMSTSLENFAGTYSNQHYGNSMLTMENGKLMFHPTAHPAMIGTFEHWSGDTLLCQWNDPVYDKSLVSFTVGKDNSVESFTVKFRPDYIDPVEYEFIKNKNSK